MRGPYFCREAAVLKNGRGIGKSSITVQIYKRDILMELKIWWIAYFGEGRTNIGNDIHQAIQRLMASIAIRTRRSKPSTSWKLKSSAFFSEWIPSLCEVSPSLEDADVKAILDFLDASIAKLTSCAYKGERVGD